MLNKLSSGVRKCIRFIMARNLFCWMPDRPYLKLLYWAQLGKKLNLNNPKTFNEKLQWLKLYDRKPEYTQMVDKYEAKKYAADRIGEEYIIPTLGAWDRFDEIDFAALPEQFVLKCTHDSGGLVICRDKSEFDREAARIKINGCLKRNYKFEEMLDFAKKLSRGFSFLRIDLYQINAKIYFSEFTFYPCSSLMPFVPEKYDGLLYN